MGIAVVGMSDAAEPLLSSSVPDLREEQEGKDEKNKQKRERARNTLFTSTGTCESFDDTCESLQS